MGNLATIEKLAVPDAALHAWALDFPAAGKAPRINERGLYLQGWVLEQTGAVRGALQARVDGHVREIPFNNARPDVIQRVLGVTPEGHAQQRCGFIAYLADRPKEFELGVALDGSTHWLWRVQLDEAARIVPAEPAMQVIEGSDSWLFLDNDTNCSVDQFVGRLTLDEQGIAKWQSYLDGCASLAAAANAAHAIVLAASKEQVLPEHYPHKKGERTVYEQVLQVCGLQHHVLDTAALLSTQSDKEACFIKTDTHWTDRGAMQATLALLRELGLDADLAQESLAADVYYIMPFAGDLGVKLTPALAAATEFLQAPPPAAGAAFDNKLPNIGRVLIFDAADATWDMNMLVFGASSSYPMLKYLKRLFSRIVFVHSAGNVDADIVRHEQPDLLVMQTTARFMIDPPDTAFDLAEAVLGKLNKSSANGGAQGHSALEQAMSERNLHYAKMLDVPT